MEVSQVADHVTHAVIGGKQAINFGVSDDAALMNVLSKALYTDPELAVIRETLCNGWDAHIESGNTDKALHVILTEEELVIRDFGNGIPHRLIGPVYGTYGGSTKKTDKRQTGGFGLGCKSPFAYGDHFEVTSWSVEDKTMTVYNMSKSNAEVGGRPAIVPIVTVPTTEQGLQVRIKLNQRRDYHRFEMLIRRIARNGEMKVRFNGAMIPVLPFNLMEHGWLMTDQPLIETRQKILVRYGHVIYPVESHESFSREYNQIESILAKLPGKSGNFNCDMKIVFQAPASEISITPSREALSMQEGTVAIIGAMLKDFLGVALPRIEAGCNKVMVDSINSVWLTSAPKVIFETKDKIPNAPGDRDIEPIVTNFEQFIGRYASAKYPEYDGFREREHLHRIDALIEAGFGDRRLLKSFRAELSKHFNDPKRKARWNYVDPGKGWFQKNLLWPLVKGLMADPMMHEDKLFLRGKNRDERWGDVKLFRTKELPDRTLWGFFKFLRKIVILAHNRIDVEDRASNFPIMKHWLGTTEDVFVYTVARSPKKVEAALEFFQKRGFVILDLTKAQPWEHVEAAAPQSREYAVAPRRKGLPKLTSALTIAGLIDLSKPATVTENLVNEPKFVIKYSPKTQENYKFEHHSQSVSLFIINEWGDEGGFVVNANQQDKYVGAGAMLYVDFVLEKIHAQLLTNPRIRASLPFMWNRSDVIMKKGYGRHDYAREHKLLGAVYADKDLVEYFGLVQTMTPKDKMYLTMWQEFKSEGLRGTKGFYQKIEELLATFLVDQKVMDLFDQIRKSDVLHVFDESFLEEVLTSATKVTPQRRTLIRDMLLNAIEA